MDPNVLRAELAQALGNVHLDNCTPASVTAPAPPSTPASPEETAAFGKAQSAVAVAIARGHMTKEQSQEMRDVLSAVDSETRQELRLQMIRALNQGKLTLEDRGPPF